MLVPLLLATSGLVVLPDGRRAHVLKHDEAVADFLVARVSSLANAAIEEKGAFSLSIGSGTTVKPLSRLADAVDCSRVHVFFGNERTEGDAAGKCFSGAADFVAACSIPAGNVHPVPSLPAEEAAAAYEAVLRSASPTVASCACA